MKSTTVVTIYLLIIGLLVLGCPACGGKDEFPGVYTAFDEGPPAKENTIRLKQSGEGVWRCCDETEENEVSFSWSIKGKELRFYFKGGGVITAEVRKKTFVMELPERKELVFHKTGDLE